MYYYSAKTNSFYPAELRGAYEESNSFPDDTIQVSSSVWLKYAGSEAPQGMVRAADKNGMPCWSAIPDKDKSDYIAEAENKKKQRLSEVSNETQIWQTQLSLKIINDSDKSKLKEWMLYAQKIQSIDASRAPDIVWPEPPKK